MEKQSKSRGHWYDRWHRHPLHASTHWAIFLAVAIGITGFVMHNYSVAQVEINIGAAVEAPNAVQVTLMRLDRANEVFRVKKKAYDFSRSLQSELAMAEAAKQRLAVLRQLADNDPASVLKRRISETERNTFPESVKKYVERDVTLSGIYSAPHGDTFDGRTPIQFYELAVGKTYYTILSPNNLPVRQNVKATVDGLQVHNALVVDLAGNVTTGDSSVSTTENAPRVLNVAAIIITVEGQSAPASVSATTAALGRVGEMYRETSFGMTDVTGTVFSPTVPTGIDGCVDYYGIAAAADTALTAQGVDLRPFTHRTYIINSSCSWGGKGQVNGTITWLSGLDSGSWSHEIGHNLGASHAGTPTNTYGEQVATMGWAYNDNTHNAPHKYLIGWIPSTNVQTIVDDGTFTVASAETANSAAQLLKVKKDATYSYYVSYRKPYGVYDYNVAQKIYVHQWVTNVSYTSTILVAILDAGQTFADSTAGVTITANTLGDTSATVTVDVSCTRAAPTVAAPASLGVFPGTSKSFIITVQNNDSTNCPTNSTFRVTPQLPEGWTQSPVADFTLAPGASKDVSVTITVPNTATVGSTNTVSEVVSNTANAALAATANTTVTIAAPDTVAPTISTLSPAEGTVIKGSKVTISANATDPDPASGMSTIELLFDNVVKKTCSAVTSCSFNLNMGKVKVGAHTVGVRAKDLAGNTSTKTNNVTK